jgi:hypothetical protein
MSDDELRKRIVCDSTRMTDKPVIRETRLTVDFILNLLAQGSAIGPMRPGAFRRGEATCWASGRLACARAVQGTGGRSSWFSSF